MSRIGKKPVTIPSGVTVALSKGAIEVKGPKGTLSFPLRPEVNLQVEDGSATIGLTGSGGKRARAMHGLTRAHVANMVEGVTKGFEKKLEVHGVGWNVKLEGQTVVLSVGYCHPVKHPVPKGIEVEVPSQDKITVRGIDKIQVGEFAARLRKSRPPEPYKGKGVRYSDEVVRRKAGKAIGS
ncbi:MAG: 50S ribosomal protein L6 [Planctomycetes bacterium]|nr:50S ribosomal protein L6 [Planctomycetota bacterium]